MMIAAGERGRPGVGLALSTGAEVSGVKFVETGVAESQLTGGCGGADLAGAEALEEMTNERGWQTVAELKFFMAATIPEESWIYRFAADTGRASRAGTGASPTCRLSGFRRRSGCVPAEPYPPLKQGYATGVASLGNRASMVFRF